MSEFDPTDINYRKLYGHLVAKKTVINDHNFEQWTEGKEYNIGLVGICDQAVQVFVFMQWNCIVDFVLWGDDYDEFDDLFDWYDPQGKLLEEY
jgi:hypothetical protein